MTIRRLIRALQFSLLAILTLSLVACGLQIQRKDQGPLVKPPKIPTNIVEPEKVQVTFSVQSPKTSFDSFQLALDILDDLSGYKDNINRYPMQSKGDNRFEVSVLLDKGFDYRYRYVIVDPSEVVETQLSGQPVDLRMVIADDELQVNDVISNWSPSEVTGPVGTISGHLKDYKTQKGIPDLLITVAGKHTFTNMSGFFRFENVPEGTHNLVAYAVDGRYAPMQQRANVSANINTRVDTRLIPLEKVKFQFQVKPSNETVGVPIRLAGNFVGLGAQYEANFSKSGSIASLMPLLNQVESENYTLDLELYAGSAFRYRYTIGNGYFNAERSETKGLVTRQFIVPKNAATIKDHILTWRADDLSPITVNVDIPIQTPPDELVSIQLLRKEWDQPIPMWHVRDQKWMYLLFSNGQEQSLELRFCRNDNCELGFDESSHEQAVKAHFNEVLEINHQITGWHNWTSEGKIAEERAVSNAQKGLTGMEFTHVYRPADLPFIKKTISQLKNNGVNWLIFRPAWEVFERNGLPYIQFSEKETMLHRDLAQLIETARNAGMKVSLFPNITFPMKPGDWWRSASRSEAFWQQWYQQYDLFLNNYAIFAKTNHIDHLIIGEEGVRFSLPGALEAEAGKLGTPDTALETWHTMIDQIRKQFQGKLLWAGTFNTMPEKVFLFQFDGSYVLVNYSADLNDSSLLKSAIDSFVNEHDPAHEKLIFVALNLPSLNIEAMEYTDLMEPIIASASNGNERFLDLNKQSQLYTDFTCGLNDYTWLSGVSSRGFNGTIRLTDISSSIYGKPAMDAFLNCRNISQ